MNVAKLQETTCFSNFHVHLRQLILAFCIEHLTVTGNKNCQTLSNNNNE